MIVARQFIAWYSCETRGRPVGSGMIGSDERATSWATTNPGYGSTVPYGTDSLLNGFQTINCLATIVSPSGTKSDKSASGHNP